MLLEDTIIILVRLISSGVATFFAILLWSRTRETAWLLAVIAVVISFAEVVFTTMEFFGLVRGDTFVALTLFRSFLAAIPYVFFSAAFLVALARRP